VKVALSTLLGLPRYSDDVPCCSFAALDVQSAPPVLLSDWFTLLSSIIVSAASMCVCELAGVSQPLASDGYGGSHPIARATSLV